MVTHALPRLLLACVLSSSLGGCYVMQAAQGQWAVQRAQRPIEQVLADPATPPATAAQLARVQAIRAYAVDALRLPANASYTTYADLKRPYVVWNVVATPAYSVTPRRWCFPVTGCIAYRGYFRERSAQRFADRLRRRGDDVGVSGVPAYSTLGWFRDPVLNSMLHWDEAQLAGILFHELMHQRLYIAGDPEFNEALATVVEFEGVRRWLTQRNEDALLQRYLRRKARWFAVADLLANTRRQLAQDFAAAKGDSARLAERKAARYADLRADYAALKAKWVAEGAAYTGWDSLFGADLNNATLAAVATYHRCVPGLERELAAVGGDLEAYHARLQEMAKWTRARRHAAVCSAAGG